MNPKSRCIRDIMNATTRNRRVLLKCNGTKRVLYTILTILIVSLKVTMINLLLWKTAMNTTSVLWSTERLSVTEKCHWIYQSAYLINQTHVSSTSSISLSLESIQFEDQTKYGLYHNVYQPISLTKWCKNYRRRSMYWRRAKGKSRTWLFDTDIVSFYQPMYARNIQMIIPLLFVCFINNSKRKTWHWVNNLDKPIYLSHETIAFSLRLLSSSLVLVNLNHLGR